MTRLLALTLLLLSSTALAHPRIDEARQALFEEANFEAAAAALENALDVGNLSRGDYLEVLALRALLAHAMGDADGRDEYLRQLVSLEPEYELPPEAPPDVREQRAAAAQAFRGERVASDIALDRDGDRFSGRLELRDPANVVASTQLVCRAGEEIFRSQGSDVFGLTPHWQSVSCEARLLGAGGTLLFSSQARLDPLGERPAAPRAEGPNGRAIGLGIGITAAILGAVAVGLYFAFRPTEERIDPSNTFVSPEFFME
ncbi:MAG: hypothetical protein AAGE52_27225 [Myxococcota bacterium]